MSSRDDATDRVWATLPPGTREALVSGLSPADLHSLLLDVFAGRAGDTRPADLLRRWEQSRFVRPSDVPARAVAAVEARLWAALPEAFEGVVLSPVTPFGTTAAMTGTSQDRVVSATRGTEVVSDPTNVLAIEAATRRRRSGRQDVVHLAASTRVVRAQALRPGQVAHFGLFSLVSSARDSGSAQTEARLLTEHLLAWREVLASAGVSGSRVQLSGWTPALRVRIRDVVLGAVPQDDGFALVEDHERERARSYYSDGALLLEATTPDGWSEIGDGGFTRWTATLLQDAKERCLVSCVAVDRLASALTLRPNAAHSERDPHPRAPRKSTGSG